MSGRTTHRLDERGTVRDWLVAGGWAEPVDLSGALAADGSPWGPDGRWVLTNGPDVTPLKARLHERWPLRDQPLPAVVEGGEVAYTGPTGAEHRGTWRRVHTASDGLVDWSEFCFTPELRIAAAATAFEVDQAEWRTLKLASTGPVQLYVGGECVLRTGQVTYMEPAEHEVKVWLPSGVSEVVVCSWQIGFRECRQVVRLRVGGLPVRVVVPSPGADELSSEFAEQVLDGVGTPRWGLIEPEVELTAPDGVTLNVRCGHIDRTVTVDGGSVTIPLAHMTGDAGVGSASMLTTGEHTVRVSVPGSPLFRDFPVVMLPHGRTTPVGGPEDWRREVLEHAAQGPNGCAAELAALALDPGHALRPKALERSLWMIGNRADCADFEALGLLHLWHRREDVREHVREPLLGLKYWIDQPGLDAMCYFTENHQVVWHTAELLAGQAFAQDVFQNTGWSGTRHAEHGRDMAEQWLTRKLAGGYSEFDSNAYLAVDVLALTSLVEFADDETIRDLARRLLDKTLLTLAFNSWYSAHVSAHDRSYVQTQRTARLEETASIMWLCWGMGALNHATLPATVLATAQRYQLPPRLAEASRVPEEWLGKQRYRGEYRLRHDLLCRPYASDLVVYKTPDAMLSSVQDYRSGLPGLQEHIWGATLGPETQIYVTHAPNDATHSSARPNAWAGNRILPRVHQHRNTVLAVYRIPHDDPMGFTHGWFPLSTLDEWVPVDPWLVGRRGDGYVALATQGGCRVLTTGPNAYQEIRARGAGTSWVCVVGRRAVDGSFAEFIGGLDEPEFEPDGVDYRGLSLRWTGPFTVDGRPAGLGEEPLHLDNPLCRMPFGTP
ncbi:hypothetical protein ALI144C_06030 [Actinosynnema sp. ALI-1.44]|uniref:hypothetical protein n=1 Tax=Actinosynnema sp. ALI-1.44 TaxID=1933779 RepID=UPI00097C97F1|nr:hypothetical protein [Actinosynnema sp. ALI-1.44]ONI88594.1 hypothetical protein ALI144C_06030 [Actinosynnema sp. ALI-1.44]